MLVNIFALNVVFNFKGLRVTVCPRSSSHFINWVTTSWTDVHVPFIISSSDIKALCLSLCNCLFYVFCLFVSVSGRHLCLSLSLFCGQFVLVYLQKPLSRSATAFHSFVFLLNLEFYWWLPQV